MLLRLLIEGPKSCGKFTNLLKEVENVVLAHKVKEERSKF
jgi:hypothetical protein